MVASSNPDAAEISKWKYERACREFQAGGSEHVFRASLFGIGYTGNRLDNEVNYQRGLMAEPKQSQYKGGLPERAW